MYECKNILINHQENLENINYVKVDKKSLCYTKFHERQNEKSAKKKLIFRSCDWIFKNFLKNVPKYIDPSGHFVFYKKFVAQTSITMYIMLI